ncbi:MAG: alpha/beta fold hydrolase [Armatimonadota bacterium]
MKHLRQFLFTCAALVCVIFCTVSVGSSNDTEVLRNLTYRTVGSTELTLDIFRPLGTTQATPVILAVHGGSWIMDDRWLMRPMVEYLSSHGYAVVLMSYRLAPQFTYPAQLEDTRAAARWVQAHAEEYHFDMQRFYLLGYSAGGQLAALVGTQPQADIPRAAGVVLLSAPQDFTAPMPSLKAKVIAQVYLDARQDDNPKLYAEASPITYVTKTAPPFFFIHGTKDSMVPYDQTERMARALRAQQVPVTIYPLEGIGHEPPPVRTKQGQAAMDAMLEFLQHPGKTAAAPEPAATAP